MEQKNKQRLCELLWMLWFDEKSISNVYHEIISVKKVFSYICSKCFKNYTWGKEGSIAAYNISAAVCSTVPSGLDKGFLLISSSLWKSNFAC